MSQTPDTYDVFQQRLGSNGARRTPGRFSGDVAGPRPAARRPPRSGRACFLWGQPPGFFLPVTM